MASFAIVIGLVYIVLALFYYVAVDNEGAQPSALLHTRKCPQPVHAEIKQCEGGTPRHIARRGGDLVAR